MPSTAASPTDTLTDTPPAAPTTVLTRNRYDAFVSYSHAKDKAVASALQSVVQRLGKAWHQRRALRLFRDDSSLTATPHLWPAIEAALGNSRFLVLLASPQAAASAWVDKEVAWWLDRNSAETILIGLTAGELDWDGTAGDFHPTDKFPLPPALKGRFTDEPLWIDLRAYRDAVNRSDPDFANLAAGIAAALHGIPKEDLLSQEMRQQRRALQLAWSGLATLVVLLGIAGWQWRVAEVQRAAADAQRARAEHAVATATETADGLVLDLTTNLRNLGLPTAVAGGLLDQVLKLQDQLISGGETNPKLRYSQADALVATSSTLLAYNDSKGALAQARHAHDILDALLKESPNDTAYLNDSAVADERIGDALKAQGDFPGALAAYREGAVIDAKLVAADPGNPMWEPNVAFGRVRIGDVLKAQGDLAGALAAYRQTLEQTKAFAAKEPDDPRWRREQVVVEQRIGEIMETKGDVAGALASYRESLGVAQSLAASDPSNTQWQFDVSVSEEYIGNVLVVQGDNSGALASFQDELNIRRKLLEKDPENIEIKGGLGSAEQRIGQLQLAAGDLDHALFAFHGSLIIAQNMAAKDPDNPDWQVAIATCNQKIGMALEARRDWDGALASYRTTLATFKTLVAKYPSNPEWAFDLAVANESVGNVLFQQGDIAGAMTFYNDDFSSVQKLVTAVPGNMEWQSGMVTAAARVGAVFLRQNNLPGALEAYERALKAALILQAADPAASLPNQEVAYMQKMLTEIRRRMAG